jgi:hypothetical protein
MEPADGDGVLSATRDVGAHHQRMRGIMGRYLLLWLLGIPLPILLLIWVFGGLH